MSESAHYVIDASSLIDLQQWRPPRKYRKVWQNSDSLVRSERLMSPDEVYTELRQSKDDLARWALRHRREKHLFRRTTRQLVGIAKEIISKFPDLIERDRPVPQADPFVIALAVYESRESGQLFSTECIVVTNEKYTPTGRPRIPHVCADYQLSYVSIHQLYVREGWTF